MTPTRLAARIVAAAFVVLATGQADAASCTAEIGRREAQILVGRCTDISPATHPPCNAANSCALIRDEIARGCGMAGADAPEWCENDDDEDADG